MRYVDCQNAWRHGGKLGGMSFQVPFKFGPRGACAGLRGRSIRNCPEGLGLASIGWPSACIVLCVSPGKVRCGLGKWADVTVTGGACPVQDKLFGSVTYLLILISVRVDLISCQVLAKLF